MNRKTLYWLPLFILPICNVLIALILKQSIAPVLPYILGAVVEELFFRLFLLRTIFLPRIKPALAILLVSVLFAGMHLFNLRAGAGATETLVQMIFAFCFSIWAGAVTWKSTWLIPLAAHVLLNLTATADVMWVSLVAGLLVLSDGIILMRSTDS